MEQGLYGFAQANTATNLETFGITVGGGGVLTTGTKGYTRLPTSGIITKVTLLADQAGTIAIDIKKCTYKAFPTTTSICASSKPTLTSAQAYEDANLKGWNKQINAGDIIEFVVDSGTTPATLTQVSVIIEMIRR